MPSTISPIINNGSAAAEAKIEWPQGSWKQWQRHLNKRKRPARLGKPASGKPPQLLWGISESVQPAGPLLRLMKLGDAADSSKTKLNPAEQLEAWLAAGPEPTLEEALETLAWCRALPDLSGTLSEELWSNTFKLLNETAKQAGGVDAQSQALVHQLLAVELPLTLGFLFPELSSCEKFVPLGARGFIRSLHELLDGDGAIVARLAGEIRPLLASWTRCGLLLKKLDKQMWKQEAAELFEGFLTYALRLSRGDGSAMFGPNGEKDRFLPLIASSLTLVDKEITTAASHALPGIKPVGNPQLNVVPEPAGFSAWAELAVLRTAWKRSSPRLSLTFTNRRMPWELEAAGETLLGGEWKSQITINGEACSPEGDWEEVCWHSDDDLDYLELEVKLSGDWRLQRQMILAREDEFLLLADSILPDPETPSWPPPEFPEAEIEYLSQWNCGSGVSFHPEKETRECFLAGEKGKCLVMPLAAPEWNSEPWRGELKESAGTLSLKQTAKGRRLYAPLFFDLKPKRLEKQRTWRRLTVAEGLAIQPADMAVGYRVQVGSKQWLIYRSLGPKGNRSLLGQNIACDFYLGRFTSEGLTEELIEVE